jgi:hypothetical protein
MGTGHLYQGRFQSFPVAADKHFLQLCRNVERNALRASRVRAPAITPSVDGGKRTPILG